MHLCAPIQNTCKRLGHLSGKSSYATIPSAADNNGLADGGARNIASIIACRTGCLSVSPICVASESSPRHTAWHQFFNVTAAICDKPLSLAVTEILSRAEPKPGIFPASTDAQLSRGSQTKLQRKLSAFQCVEIVLRDCDRYLLFPALLLRSFLTHRKRTARPAAAWPAPRG